MEVSVDGTLTGFILNGSYVPYHVLPGRHVFALSGTKPVTMDVAAGEVRYVEFHSSMGSFTLREPKPEDGKADVADCSLLPGGYDARDRI